MPSKCAWRVTEIRPGWLQSNNNDLQKYRESGSFSQTIEGQENISTKSEDIHLTLDHETGEWELSTPANIEPYPVQTHSEYRTSSSKGSDVTDEVRMETSVIGSVFNGKAVAGAGILQAEDNQTYKDPDGTNGREKSGHITVLPEWADVKLVVTFDAHDSEPPMGFEASSGTPIPYEKWRPRASMEHPGRAGNYINVTAELRPSDMKKDAPLPDVKMITFELLDTSREPGIMMNWPRGAMDRESEKRPDMRLVIDPSSPGDLSKEDQTLDVATPKKNAEGHPIAKARIDSYDFGGRTELRVTAKLAGRHKIVGELDTDEYTYTEILVPKRNHDGWVADVWKADHNVMGLADDDDSEDKPEGDGDKGDGLTLYEEYRGFAAKNLPGKRVEGDPKRKDLFVLNLIGADAVQGLKMFEKKSGLHTIYQLVPPEILENDRVINFNYDKAPYRRDDKNNHNDQHGIVIKTLSFDEMGGSGAETRPDIGALAGKAFRPKVTSVVAMPDKKDPEADVNKPYNMPPEGFAIQYPSTLVHEMLHAVGVSHHGEGDTWGKFYYVPETFKANPHKKKMFFMKEYKNDDEGNPVFLQKGYVIVRKETRESYAQSVSAVKDQRIAELTAEMVADNGWPAVTTFPDLAAIAQAKILDRLTPYVWTIGHKHGEHSGDELCPMRYNFAEVYQSRLWSPVTEYFLVPEGTEIVGVTICKTDKGSAANGKDHKPEPRYGDAMDHRGKCVKQINVNDAMPLYPKGWRD